MPVNLDIAEHRKRNKQSINTNRHIVYKVAPTAPTSSDPEHIWKFNYCILCSNTRKLYF